MTKEEQIQKLIKEFPSPGLVDWKKKQELNQWAYLSPHPIYFSIDGRPSETEWITITGYKYKVRWNGRDLRLIEHEDNGNGGKEGQFNNFKSPERNPGPIWFIFIAIIVGGYIWFKFLKWLVS